MLARKFLQHTVILVYLLVTLSALFFTMTKVHWPPIIPWPVTRYAYGMMAPYQGYARHNADLLAEGKRNSDKRPARTWSGTDGLAISGKRQWEIIDLDPYYPMHRGSAIMYKRLRSARLAGEETHKEIYQRLAKQLLNHERAKGNDYETVRLTWQQWPKSPKGFEAMRTEEHTTNYFITEVHE